MLGIEYSCNWFHIFYLQSIAFSADDHRHLVTEAGSERESTRSHSSELNSLILSRYLPPFEKFHSKCFCLLWRSSSDDFIGTATNAQALCCGEVGVAPGERKDQGRDAAASLERLGDATLREA
jgi:hypothetical protein